MKEKAKRIKAEIERSLADVSTVAGLKEVRSKYLSRSGEIPALLKLLGSLPKEERPEAGRIINELKNWAEEVFDSREAELAVKELEERYARETLDISMPAEFRRVGTLHPVTLVREELVRIFSGMGFIVYEGPEIEDDYHNFTALNTPRDHPARDKQDTFYINEDLLLRTQTSPAQIRMMETTKPPFKVVSPGCTFRRDDDATHSPMFQQMEGLVIDRGLSLCDLHGLLDIMAKNMFSSDAKTRFRPSYFPFTEPSVEVDVSCFECGGAGCRLCKGTGWIEILGAGVVNRRVIVNCGLDPDEWTGLAFGLGLERIAMLKYGINNISLFYDGDVRILSQFR
ncbi:MAG: phenylalanine--tRNA ligase subunit alpha [Eubacteriales bacterium]|jgi:phenylalanyl-tRNA synthetase alpha chain